MVIEANASTASGQAASLHVGDDLVCTAHHAADGCAEYQAARSVESYSQRLLGELFGWEFAPQVPLRERTARVIFEQLVPKRDACDPAHGDLRALAPSPEVDIVMRRLVAIVQGQGADFPPPCSIDPHSGEFQRDLHAELVRRIQQHPVLKERARVLRSIAALAETALEHHFSQRLLTQLRTRSAPETPLAAAGHARTQALCECLGDFPYTQNYVQLLAAEVALLNAPSKPVLLRDRELLTLTPKARRLFQAERDKLRAQCESLPATPATLKPLQEQSIAVCGCGPLPITGLMLHTWTGARVRLIDRDASSAAAARIWVEELERLHVLEKGAVRVHELDIDALTFGDNPTRSDSKQDSECLDCDIVLIASLVQHEAKERFAQRLQANIAGSDSKSPTNIPHTLLLRSATGLCAELAYEAVSTRTINHMRLAFCGESLPRNQVWQGLDAVSAGLRGVTADTSSELLVIAHRNVLNSTELYRRLPLGNEQVAELATLEKLVATAHPDRPSRNETYRTP